jgi:hypothetical protein
MKKEYNYIGECKGNNGNGCFMDSCGHDCGCFTIQERMYSEEEVIKFGQWLSEFNNLDNESEYVIKELLERFKNK